jgi:hypothetical protein
MRARFTDRGDADAQLVAEYLRKHGVRRCPAGKRRPQSARLMKSTPRTRGMPRSR